ncbi:alpha-ketoacid dehydrogenase subunit alpha/beta [Phaeobacter italicus]|uniref:alpha-ketoacid dehydrogenase subunit alpha/beta n=1 Tax=Phaeobacter italicus TaxID=481446 RepID=UPI002FDB042C
MTTEKNFIKPIRAQDKNFAYDMLSEIAFIRAFEESALGLTQVNPPRVPGSMHFCAGQEAVPLGAAAGLRDTDQMLATYRGHGWALASGLDARSVMAEICQKADGINGGRGGSAYLMAPETRFVGENSIVGAGTTIACGVAMANLATGNGNVVTVTIGDGATNQGAVHEAIVFAAARKLPVIFVVENNGWAELTPVTRTIKVDRIAQRATGYGIPSATIEGHDPIAVRDSFAMAAEQCRAGKGPILLEFKVPRLWGHYNRDIEHYRPKQDKREAETRDPLLVLGKRLVASGFMTEAEVAAAIEAQTKRAKELTESVMAGSEPEIETALEHVIAPPSNATPQVTETKLMSYIEAVNLAMRTELENDPSTVLYGEDVGHAGGIFGGSRYLQRDFGEDRVFDTPIAENAILGSAVGAAMSGLKPIVEIMWADFIFVALDQLINQAANIRYLTRGKVTCPIVVRTQQGVTPGSCAQHSQSIEAFLAHIPGLKVALAASAADAYALLRAASADPDPCVVIEARGMYPEKGEVEITDVAEPVGKARLRRSGGDLAIVTWGTMVPKAIEAAELLAADGIEASVLDLRWLNPLDNDALLQVATDAKGKVIIAHEAVRTGGFAGEIAMRLHENAPQNVTLDVRRVTTPDVRIPSNARLQSSLIPSVDDIVGLAKSMK